MPYDLSYMRNLKNKTQKNNNNKKENHGYTYQIGSYQRYVGGWEKWPQAIDISEKI